MNNQLKLGKGLKYMVVGAGVVNIFIQLTNFVLLFYTIIIERNTFLLQLFPSIINFSIIGSVVWAILLFTVGWLWRNRSTFFTADREVDVHTDVYNTKRFTPVMIPVWQLLIEIAEKQSCSQTNIAKIKQIIQESEK